MALFKHIDGRQITIPDEGVLYRRSDAPVAFVRTGGTLYQAKDVPNLESLPMFQYTGDMEQALRLIGGPLFVDTNYKSLPIIPKLQNEVLTRTQSSNAEGADLSSNIKGQIVKTPSVKENLAYADKENATTAALPKPSEAPFASAGSLAGGIPINDPNFQKAFRGAVGAVGYSSLPNGNVVDLNTGKVFLAKDIASAMGTTTGISQGGTSTTGSTATTNTNWDAQVAQFLNNPNITADQKTALQALFTTVSNGDSANAAKMAAAFNAASAYSEPFFKAQIAILTNALDRGLQQNTGDLAYNEKRLQNTLKDLQDSATSSKDQLSFEHGQELAKLARSYETDLETTQQNLAAVGKTDSSVRSRAESLLSEQNTGLVQSSNKKFAYDTGNIDAKVAGGVRDTALDILHLQDKATQDRIAALRTTEEQIGSGGLTALGYSGTSVLGGVPSAIERKQVTDALSFTSNYF